LTERFWKLSDVVAPVLERWSRREVDDHEAADDVLKAVIEGRDLGITRIVPIAQDRRTPESTQGV
jgi:hypothetical protein